jgi:hypothetical protein
MNFFAMMSPLSQEKTERFSSVFVRAAEHLLSAVT